MRHLLLAALVCVFPQHASHGECPDGAAAVDTGTAETPARICMDRTEVTSARYASCAAQGACTATVGAPSAHREAKRLEQCTGNTAGDLPINCVTQKQAQAFCTFEHGRLPTDVEWDRAARGTGTPRTWPWGEEPPAPSRLNACGAECASPAPKLAHLYTETDGHPALAPVGSAPEGATPEGVLDLAGNVREWTASSWTEQVNGKAAAQETRVTVRGSSFLSSDPARSNASARFSLEPTVTAATVGFRCVYPVK